MNEKEEDSIKILSYEITGVDLYKKIYQAQQSEAIFLFTYDNNISGYRPMTAQDFINNIN